MENIMEKMDLESRLMMENHTKGPSQSLSPELWNTTENMTGSELKGYEDYVIYDISNGIQLVISTIAILICGSPHLSVQTWHTKVSAKQTC